MNEHEALSSLKIYCMNLEHARVYHPKEYEVFKPTHEQLKLVLPLAEKQLLLQSVDSVLKIAKDLANGGPDETKS